MIYGTVAEGFANQNVNPPEHGQFVDRGGNYATGVRHAYVMGTQLTLCERPFAEFVYVTSPAKWHEGGDFPPRCPVCAARAV